MGAILSAEESTDLHMNHNQLPQPIIIDSLNANRILPTPDDRSGVSPPKNFNLTRRRMPFMLKPDSFEVRKTPRLFHIQFKYMSSKRIKLSATLTNSGTNDAQNITRDLDPSQEMELTNVEFLSLSEEGVVCRYELLWVLTDDSDELVLKANIVNNFVSVQQVRFREADTEDTIDLLGLYSGVNQPGPEIQVHESCVVCLSSPASVAFLPCRHMCVCLACSGETLMSSRNHCPVCRCQVSGQFTLS
jgi:hypothetical protein